MRTSPPIRPTVQSATSVRQNQVRLAQLLACPVAAAGLSLADWSLVIRQARRAGVLARLCDLIEEGGALSAVPEPARLHLEAARTLAIKHAHDVRWEVRCIKQALAPLDIPIILLKGAAYLLADLPPARGRIFNDVDIMVPETRLPEVEVALNANGWRFHKLSAYDERYYRRWMHQIPPMTHMARGTTVDVHHTIVAPTRRLRLNAAALFAAAIPVGDDPKLRTLAPADMLLHSAAHLLNEGEFDRGLRDLDDMNRMLRHFGRDEGFWQALVERAEELDLRRPLFYAFRYASRMLGTPLPQGIEKTPRLRPPGFLLRSVMDLLFERALRPRHSTCRDALTGPALSLLYLRAHYLLMPARTLVPHLLRKAYARRVGRDETPERGWL